MIKVKILSISRLHHPGMLSFNFSATEKPPFKSKTACVEGVLDEDRQFIAG
jgi:hypothetical protein